MPSPVALVALLAIAWREEQLKTFCHLLARRV